MGAWHVGEHDRIESVTLSDMYMSRLSSTACATQ